MIQNHHTAQNDRQFNPAAPRSSGPIEGAINGMNNHVTALTGLVEALEKRLEPVAVGLPPTTAETAAPAGVPTCEMHERLLGVDADLIRLSGRLDSLLSRIQL